MKIFLKKSEMKKNLIPVLQLRYEMVLSLNIEKTDIYLQFYIKHFSKSDGKHFLNFYIKLKYIFELKKKNCRKSLLKKIVFKSLRISFLKFKTVI